MSKYSLSAERAATGKVLPNFVVGTPTMPALPTGATPKPPGPNSADASFFERYKTPLLVGAGVLALAGGIYYISKGSKGGTRRRKKATRRRR